MSPAWKNIQQENLAYFITTTITEYTPILKKDNYKQIILNNLDFYINKFKYDLLAYVIMPEHIHFIIKSYEENKLHNFMRDFKKYTSKQIIEELIKDDKKGILETFEKKANSKAKYAVWMQRYRSIPIYSEIVLNQKIDYIHKNPLRRRLVSDLKDYKYSSFDKYYLE